MFMMHFIRGWIHLVDWAVPRNRFYRHNGVKCFKEKIFHHSLYHGELEHQCWCVSSSMVELSPHRVRLPRGTTTGVILVWGESTRIVSKSVRVATDFNIDVVRASKDHPSRIWGSALSSGKRLRRWRGSWIRISAGIRSITFSAHHSCLRCACMLVVELSPVMNATIHQVTLC